MGAAVEHTVCLHSMTDDPTAAVRAGWRQCLDGTLKAIENMRLATHSHLKTLVIYVAAYFTSLIIPLLIHS
jgi:hypothetical protein